MSAASRHLAVIGFALLTGFGGSASRAGATPSSAPVTVTTQDQAGESCSAALDPSAARDPNAVAPLKVSCGASETAVGTVRASLLPLDVPEGGAGRHAAIENAAMRSNAAAEIGRRMVCGQRKWFPLADGHELGLASCKLRDGNWPQVVVTYADGKMLYQATGLPVLLPVLTHAIAAQSGKPLDLPQDAAKSVVVNCTAADYAASDDLLRQARLANSRGSSSDAEESYRKALDIQIRVFGPDAPGAGEMLTSLALEVSNQQRFEEASSLFRRAEPIVEKSSSDFYRARLLAYRALDAANRRQYEEALQYARSATALRRRAMAAETNLPDDSGATATQAIDRGELLHSLMIEAQMLLRLDDLASAEAAGGEALNIIVQTPDLPPWWRPSVLAFMGDLNAKEGRLAVAERQHIDALGFRRQIFGESGPTALSYLALGRIYAAEDLRPKALASFHAAFDILEKERSARAAVAFDQIAPFLAFAADPSAKPAPETDAEVFRAIQLSGASVADQTIERSAARLGSSDPAVSELIRQSEADRRRRDTLRIQYAEETGKPSALRDAQRETSIAQDIVASDKDLDKVTKQLEQNYPGYAGLAESGLVTLDAFRQVLAPGEALVSFAFGNKSGWVVLVTGDRLIARPLNLSDDTVTSRVASLRRAFVPRLGNLPRYDVGEAFSLYTDLLGPVAAELGGVRRMIVVAHGALASLPLSVLVTHAPAGNRGDSYDDVGWLIKDYAVSEVPTIRAFVAMRGAEAHRTQPAMPFLGYAAPAFSGAPAQPDKSTGRAVSALTAISDECRQGGPVAPEMLRALAPLPETATEVTTIAALLGAAPGSVHIGANASETNLRQQKLDQYGVLYFATHGLLPGELRCQSEPGLALSPPSSPAQSAADDGLLEASEIASLKLDADLVVLSACNTAQGGDRFGGDALSGLAEAFFFAGARGLIASHWEVPSKATVTLMTGLFGQVKTLGTAEALRQSQLRLLTQSATAHPFYWGAFTLIGDGLIGSERTAARQP